MKREKLLSLLVMIVTAIPVFAEKITIQQATELAIKNNKSIKIQMLEVEKSRLTVDKAWKNAYFSVNYNASAGRFFKEVGTANNSYTHNISLSQPIYTGGAIKSAINLGKESLELSELTLDKTKKDVILNTVQAYINVYDAQNTLAVYELSKEALEQNYKEQKAKFDLRMVTQPELLESERSLKEIEATIISQRANVDITKETLGNLIGKKMEEVEIVPFGVSDKFTSLVDLQKDLQKLKTNNTEYLMAQKSKSVVKENINIAKADLKPKVNGIINYGTLSSQDNFSDMRKGENYNGTIGVNMTWNIFDWGARKLEIKNAEKSYEIADLQAEQVLENLEVNLKNTYYRIQALEKSLEALKTAVDAAEETYKLEEARYGYRLITLNDLLRAESNMRQSRTSYLSSRLNYYYLVSQYGSLLD